MGWFIFLQYSILSFFFGCLNFLENFAVSSFSTSLYLRTLGWVPKSHAGFRKQRLYLVEILQPAPLVMGILNRTEERFESFEMVHWTEPYSMFLLEGLESIISRNTSQIKCTQLVHCGIQHQVLYVQMLFISQQFISFKFCKKYIFNMSDYEQNCTLTIREEADEAFWCVVLFCWFFKVLRDKPTNN